MNKIKKIVNNLITPGGTLSQRVVKSGFWVFFLRIFNQGFSLLRLIILARILSPNDFGLMGIALLTMSILETFSETGFQQALIQKKEDIKLYLDSAWTVLILRGFVLFVILYFIAPHAAIFFNAPEAKPIIRVIGFSILFQAFTNIGIIYFQKELEFNKEFIYQLAGTLADFIVAISAVLILRNVWALVLGLLAGNLVRLIVSYLVHPYRPHLSSHLGRAKELFGFGKWIMGSSILIFLLGQGDDIFVGKMLAVTALGFYQMAYRISNAPATEITHVISQVTFPAYSKLQDNPYGLREAYLKTLQLTAFISIPLAAGIFTLAPEFTTIFLGGKWMPMVPAMQIFCVLGAIRSIVATMGPVFYSTGKPKIGTQLSIMQLLIMVSLIYPLTMKWGIAGTSLAVLLNNLADPWGFKKMLSILNCRFPDFSRSLLLPIATSILMCLFLQIMKNLLGVSIGKFILLVILGIAFYFMFTYFLDGKINGNRLKVGIREVFRSLKMK
jgi:O-antigen/teichoic acid export membrane protein